MLRQLVTKNVAISYPIVRTRLPLSAVALTRLRQGPPRYRQFSTDIEQIKHQADSNEGDSSASTTGVIDVEKQREIVVYYDHIYPISSSNSTFRQTLTLYANIQNQSIEQLTEKVLKLSSPLPSNVNITEFVPLKRDCGAFVKFSVPSDLRTKELFRIIHDNVKIKKQQYDSNIFRYIFNKVWNHFPTVYAVKGTPWIEDLRRFPTTKLKISFEGNSLTEEELYVLFRRYGLIVDIIPGSDSATIIFKHLRSAIAAKNCITGINLNHDKTILHIQYIPIKRVNYITDFIINHQKIAIPILLALLATVAVLIFDPIRQWFIESKITKKYSLDTYKNYPMVKFFYIPYKTIKGWITNSYDYLDEAIVSKFNEHDSINNELDDNTSSGNQNINLFWTERYEKSKQLKLWIYENINTFIIVKGPKGSGKEEFVYDHTLFEDDKLKNKILSIDCDLLSKSRSDNALLNNTSSQLGYFPVFTWTNSLSQFIDLGVQGLTGQKSGLSESKETQIKNMFSLTSQAIRSIATQDYEKYYNSIIKKNSKLPEGEKLELLKEDEYLQQHPECKPIIVINKFSRKADQSSNDFIFPLIADWSAGLIQNNLAHVIYVTADVGSVQHLNNVLPNQVFKVISLSDASSISAKQYLMDQLKLQNSKSIEGIFEPLGGRMLDLQAFIRRIKSGEEPPEALNEMITQAAEQITTFFLNNQKLQEDNNWNPAQVWVLMKLLSKSNEITYQELSKSNLFKSSSETIGTLSTLEKHDLITLKRDKGVLSSISTGRPLFKAAFKHLIGDLNVFKIYEIDYLQQLIKLEMTSITKLENELTNIYSAHSKLDGRISYLTKKIETSNSKIIDYESKINDIKKLNDASKHSSRGLFGIF
ncbi:mitochondrial inner membrane protein [Scheffersomyces amazonensis]|uniref:mitochondrial inner membrane protein n=1 Tax=Scheffersomyces amazonensis TaxID=1078765 RepID=UPI00315C8BB1